MNKVYRVYVASKESDIDCRNLYYQHKIVYYGVPDDTTDVFCNNFRCDIHYKPDFIKFVINKMLLIINKHPDCKFYFYSPKFACLIIEEKYELKKYIPLINNYTLLSNLDNKFICRSWLQEYVKVPPFRLLTLNECSDKQILLKEWPNISKFVLQYTVSNGGEGTYIFSLDDVTALASLSQHNLYMISPFIENSITVSCQMIVYKEDSLVFPLNISDSFFKNSINCRPVYIGSDFASAYNISKDVYLKIQSVTKQIGLVLAKTGYRGICGIDFILQNKNIYLIEINPRYLGSSFMVDIALLDNELPTLAYFNEDSYVHQTPNLIYKERIENLVIPLRSHVFTYNEYFLQDDFNSFLSHIPHSYEIFWDGLDCATPIEGYERDTYLFRAVERIKL